MTTKIIIESLEEIKNFLPEFSKTILLKENSISDLIKNVFDFYRLNYSIPKIFCILQILKRFSEFFKVDSNNFENITNNLLKYPKTKSNLDFTIKKIYIEFRKDLNVQIQKNIDFEDFDWNFYSEINNVLIKMIKRISKLQFGIKI